MKPPNGPTIAWVSEKDDVLTVTRVMSDQRRALGPVLVCASGVTLALLIAAIVEQRTWFGTTATAAVLLLTVLRTTAMYATQDTLIFDRKRDRFTFNDTRVGRLSAIRGLKIQGRGRTDGAKYRLIVRVRESDDYPAAETTWIPFQRDRRPAGNPFGLPETADPSDWTDLPWDIVDGTAFLPQLHRLCERIERFLAKSAVETKAEPLVPVGEASQQE